MARNLLHALLALSFAATPALLNAQDDAGPRVTARAAVEPATAAPGDEVTLQVTIDVQKGWHVYGALQDPANGAPVALVVTDLGGLRLVGGAKIPPGAAHDWFGMSMHWIEGRAVLEQTLKVPSGQPAGEVTVRGRVDYAACDEQMCESPTGAPFTATLTVTGAAAAATTPDPAPATPPAGVDFPDPFGLGGENVRATARLVPADPAPGDETTLEVTVTVAPGRHVYGADLAPDAAGVATTLEIVDAGGLRPVGAAQVPGGERHEHGVQTEYWLEGEFVVRQRFLVPLDREPGPVEVTARLDYMSCTLTQCDPPADLTVAASGAVAAAAAGGATTPAFAASLEPNPARPGETVKFKLFVTVPQGFELRGPQGEPTVGLDVLADAGLALEGDTTLGAAGDGEATGLTGTFSLQRTFSVPEQRAPGEAELVLTLPYRLEDADGALAPTAHEIRLPVTVAAGEPRSQYMPLISGGLWGLFIGGIFAGLLALLMPCTYPMIPITVSFFSKRAHSGAGTVGLSLIYGAGILLMFILIGIAVGKPIIEFASHWATNLVFALAFVAFGLSLFGLFTIQLPNSLQNVAGKAAGAGGVFGVFLMGATLVITSFTCTAPIVGALLAAGGTTSTFGIVVGMTGFGLALAVPFVVLSMLPAGTRSIPRAGMWMNDLKVFLGFIELAAALKFFSNVDVALNGKGEWIPVPLFLWIWVAIFAVTAIWAVAPLFRRRPFGVVRVAAAVAAIALTMWAGRAAISDYRDDVLTAFLPPSKEGDHEIVVDDYEAARQLAIDEQKLLLINFTGLVCNNCRLVEGQVMPNPAVAELLEPGFVEARLHIDYEEVAERMNEMVGAVFSPYYIVVDPTTGKELGRFQIRNPATLIADFRRFLEESQQTG